jgi:hypothetical protein
MKARIHPGPETFIADCAPQLERASIAIGRLDGRISGSPVASSWNRRAIWSGYARALQLSGVEIDEIDVISRATGVHLAGRPLRPTLVDEFAMLEPWERELRARGRHWTDGLPFSADASRERGTCPSLLVALDLVSQYVRASAGPDGWLTLPLLLHRLGVTTTPLPCLVAGDQRMPHVTVDSGPMFRRVLTELRDRAERGYSQLIELEQHRQRSVGTTSKERGSSSMGDLARLLASDPVQTPAAVARSLGLTISGAGKILTRAEGSGMIIEVSGRRAWRTYMTPDVATALGYRPLSRARRVGLAADGVLMDRALDQALADFDRQMAEFDQRFGSDSNPKRHLG